MCTGAATRTSYTPSGCSHKPDTCTVHSHGARVRLVGRAGPGARVKVARLWGRNILCRRTELRDGHTIVEGEGSGDDGHDAKPERHTHGHMVCDGKKKGDSDPSQGRMNFPEGDRKHHPRAQHGDFRGNWDQQCGNLCLTPHLTQTLPSLSPWEQVGNRQELRG